jgi:DNA-binding transcriptional ArsR family regulator
MLATARRDDEATAGDLWRALSNPHRRRLLDLLRQRPMTTGTLTSELGQLSRFAVMQHLGVLVDAGLVVVERRGRERVNHLNPVPLRTWYERWVTPLADTSAAALLELKRVTERTEPGGTMTESTEAVRSVRLACKLHIAASAERTFEVMTTRSLEWFPHTYGEQRTQRVVLEPRVGGAHYEDWGDGAGHLYGHVTSWDPPYAWSTRGRIGMGSVLDTAYRIEEAGDGVVVSVDKVAVGPFTDEEAAGITEYGDLIPYATAIEKLAAS